MLLQNIYRGGTQAEAELPSLRVRQIPPTAPIRALRDLSQPGFLVCNQTGTQQEAPRGILNILFTQAPLNKLLPDQVPQGELDRACFLVCVCLEATPSNA